jgi:hypothetical protein
MYILTSIRTLQRHRHELQRQWADAHRLELGELRKNILQSPDDQNVNSQTRRTELQRRQSNVSNASKRHRRFMARYQMPSWIARNAWVVELCGYHASTSWTFTIRTYNVVPWNSRIMSLAENGGLDEMQQLFEQKKASPFDITASGWTILDVRSYTLDSVASPSLRSRDI